MHGEGVVHCLQATSSTGPLLHTELKPQVLDIIKDIYIFNEKCMNFASQTSIKHGKTKQIYLDQGPWNHYGRCHNESANHQFHGLQRSATAIDSSHNHWQFLIPLSQHPFHSPCWNCWLAVARKYFDTQRAITNRFISNKKSKKKKMACA